MALDLVSSNKTFGGEQRIYNHQSSTLKCQMKFAVYLPERSAVSGKRCSVLYFLSGLTCNCENFIQKSGGQRYAAENNLIIVCPDTSPRFVNVPGEDESWDFGSGAGFYVDATNEPWKKNYQMYNYVTVELIELVGQNFPVTGMQSIFGHSMGGHGALICALKNPGLYKSVSAFAPICNPTNCAWGKKAFGGYLGADEEKWKNWDATELVKSYNGPPLELFLDQGDEDQFLKDGQLLPQNLVNSARSHEMPCVLKMRSGYDHSYFYISSFVGEHIDYHALFLK